MMVRRHYPTDISDDEWELIAEFFQVSNAHGGRLPKHEKRELLDAIFYVVRTGCQWRYLPHDFPPWETVYGQFRRWKRRGSIQPAS